ncbi:MAG: response regulator [Nitrospira sp.]|nr:response regulator [Nitrospira sp.]
MVVSQSEIQHVAFNTAFEEAAIGMALVAPDGRWLFVNRALCDILGYSAEELTRTTFQALTHPADLAPDLALVEQTLKGDIASYQMEKRYIHKAGHLVWAHLSVTLIRHPDGTPRFFFSQVKDITDHKREEIVRIRLQQAIDRAQEGLALLSCDGLLTYLNPSYAAIFDYTVSELLGTNWARLFPPQDTSLLHNVWLPTVVKEGHWQGECLGLKRGGETFSLDLSLSLLPATGEEEGAILCVCRDVTTRKQMEEDLILAKQQAEAGARAKAEFLATMSHEIRTPMNGVIGMTDLLLDTNLTAEQRDYVRTLRTSADTLLSIINDILDFSKIEAGKLTIEQIPFDLRVTIEDTLEMLAPLAHKKGLELAALIDSGVPTWVKGDPGRLRQILTNLVGNAIKFTDKGEVLVQVFPLQQHDDTVHLQLEVIDTGIGLTEETKAKLFQAFSQADSSTSRKYGGTGLGLVISKRLVELMGGEIGLHSFPGSGTQVWFTLRLGLAPTDSHPPKPAVESLRGLRLCIVDDNATNRTVLQYHATAWGMDYETAENGPAALALIRTAATEGRPFDLAIIDHHMPGTNGMDVGRAIRADPALDRTKLVLLTSLGRRGDARLAQEAGFAGYLTKPIRKGHLYECLRLVMSQSHPDTQPAKDAAPTPSSLVTRHSIAEASADVRLLVVDDNPINQKVAVRMLEKLGYRADVAGNGHEALAALAHRSYDLIFMDCQMPEMDGFEATRRIRKLETVPPLVVSDHTSLHLSPSQLPDNTPHTMDRRGVPIIAMTANATEEDRQQCLNCGMNDFISKPIIREQLEQVLSRWLPAK